MERKVIIALSVVSALLAVLCGILAFLLYNQSRFIASKSSNPYIMFDTKTAQACWSGPANNSTTKSSTSDDTDPVAAFRASPTPNAFDELLATNAANIPFCKNLK